MADSRVALIFLALAFNVVYSVIGAPANAKGANSNNVVRGKDSDSSDSYDVSSNQNYDKKKKCTFTVTVSGKGVADVFTLSSCENTNGITSISNEKFALYRNPQENLIFFSNSPSTLVVIKSEKCTERTYKTSKGKTTFEEASMSKDKCKKAVQDTQKAEKEWQEEFKKTLNEKLNKKMKNKQEELEKKMKKKQEELETKIKKIQEDLEKKMKKMT